MTMMPASLLRCAMLTGLILLHLLADMLHFDLVMIAARELAWIVGFVSLATGSVIPS